ncbi:MAG TPA: metallophosphoesterase family protein, partial [Candidatus Eisenbacteria bacterium]|nr:metallophosphoesterase family protein [Candidatus Eisenbacteria bacterium]
MRERVSGVATRLAAFGGVYANPHALAAVLADAAARGSNPVWCLGDLGGFGPDLEACVAMLRGRGVPVIQGNYDHSLGHGLADCACGYTDPRDEHFAQVSYDFTRARTSEASRAWLRALPPQARLALGGRRVLLCHGSPRRVNEFLWESQCPDGFLAWLLDAHAADVLLVSHTGLHWHRALPDGRHVVNVGAIGRPAHDGRVGAWYAELEFAAGGLEVRFRPVAYDHEALARTMEREGLPA